VQQFRIILERRGLVRRDDSRRGLLWVLAPSETELFPEEAKLEETLKQENPKGKLLELCMRLRIELPKTEFSLDGAHHVASIQMEYDGNRLCGGPCKAASRKTAEQLAARAVFKSMGELVNVECEEINDDAVEELRRNNSKGKLLEWCAARKLPLPSFEQRPSPEGMLARVMTIRSSGDTWCSRWYRASKAKFAEHAAAGECLGVLSREYGSQSHEDRKTPPGSNQPDPRTVLNQLQQQGRIKDSGFELQEHTGPSHQPIFRYIAWAITSTDTHVKTEIVEGASKKECRKNAAESLLELLKNKT
jgi:dsRNA-specific ribonuclease